MLRAGSSFARAKSPRLSHRSSSRVICSTPGRTSTAGTRSSSGATSPRMASSTRPPPAAACAPSTRHSPTTRESSPAPVAPRTCERCSRHSRPPTTSSCSASWQRASSLSSKRSTATHTSSTAYRRPLGRCGTTWRQPVADRVNTTSPRSCCATAHANPSQGSSRTRRLRPLRRRPPRAVATRVRRLGARLVHDSDRPQARRRTGTRTAGAVPAPLPITTVRLGALRPPSAMRRCGRLPGRS